jgi:DNA mismatch endonuclease (patch repair protein)
MTRSQVMSRIRSKGTKLEEQFRVIAHDYGIRVAPAHHLYGKPDFRVIRTNRLIFVNSCFWHGCPHHCRVPSTHKGYWRPKIARNVQRQTQVVRKLRSQGYSVYVVWEHDFKYPGLRGKIARLKS